MFNWVRRASQLAYGAVNCGDAAQAPKTYDQREGKRETRDFC